MIAITNCSHSLLAKSADVALCSIARGSPLLGEKAAARTAQLNLLDAIFVLVAQRDVKSAEDAPVRTTEAVRDKRRG